MPTGLDTHPSRPSLQETSSGLGESPRIVANQYDPRGRLQKPTYPSNDEVEYTFTPRSEVDTIKWNVDEIEIRDQQRTWTVGGQYTSVGWSGCYGIASRRTKKAGDWFRRLCLHNVSLRLSAATCRRYLSHRPAHRWHPVRMCRRRLHCPLRHHPTLVQEDCRHWRYQ